MIICVFPSVLPNTLFPALSFLAVGGILFLITNMQVLKQLLVIIRLSDR